LNYTYLLNPGKVKYYDLSHSSFNIPQKLLEIRPYVGFNPTMLVHEEGSLTEPPASVPIDNNVDPKEMEDALPDDDPPTHNHSEGFIIS